MHPAWITDRPRKNKRRRRETEQRLELPLAMPRREPELAKPEAEEPDGERGFAVIDFYL